MVAQILAGTPLWVWPLFGILLYRGFASRVDREVPLWVAFVIPLTMLGLSLQDVLNKFSGLAALAAWAIGLAFGARIYCWRTGRDGVRADPVRRMVLLRGSWLPLITMMAIFCTKYAVGVSLALNPALQQLMSFSLVVSGLYGLFSGIFGGQLLHVVTIYRMEVGRTRKLM